MQVDELRNALREAAAGQPSVSPTAKRAIRRRVMFRRVAGAAVVLAVVGGAAAGVAVTSGSQKQRGGTRVITQPGVTTTAVTAPPTSVAPVPVVVTPHETPVPAGFGMRSVTFVSAHEGWALGGLGCAPSFTGCRAVIGHTLDGGRSWASAPAPPVSLDEQSGIRFANGRDGWVFGQALWTTHDGGMHWTKSSLTDVYALEAGAGVVHAVVFDQSKPSFVIESSPVSKDSWSRSSTTLAVGAGPIPDIQIVLNGSAGWMIQNDRTVIDGARLINGTWQAWTPPCLSAGGPAHLAASSPTQLVADCTEGVFTGPAVTDHLYTSTDAGITFTRTAAVIPRVQSVGSIASPASGVVLVGTFQGIAATFDGGASWQTVDRAANTDVVGFTTPSQGVAIAGNGQLLMTHDGGHSWAVVPFS